jgi:hypothetical protein
MKTRSTEPVARCCGYGREAETRVAARARRDKFLLKMKKYSYVPEPIAVPLPQFRTELAISIGKFGQKMISSRN